MAITTALMRDLLSGDEEQAAARALDLLSIVARGLQETDTPALALAVAAGDLFDLVVFALLRTAQANLGAEGVELAKAAVVHMLVGMQKNLDQYVEAERGGTLATMTVPKGVSH